MPSARAREDSDPSTTQDTAAGADAARTAGETGPAATSGAASPTDDAHPGAADGLLPDAEGDRVSSVLTNGALGRSDAAALGSLAADTGSVAPAPEIAAPSDLLDPQGTAAEATPNTTAAAVGATAAEADSGSRLGRPGRPVLAFAAIAGVVLMVTPFAVSETSQRLPGTEFDLVDQEGVLGYFVRSDTSASAESAAMTAQRTSVPGSMAGVEEPAPDSGYVPEVLSQEDPEQGGVEDTEGPGSDDSGSEAGGSPDGGSGDSSDGEDSDASGNDPSSGPGGEEEDEDTRESGSGGEPGEEEEEDTRESGSDGESGDSGDSEIDGDSPLGDLPDHNTNGPLALIAPDNSGQADDADAPAEEADDDDDADAPADDDDADAPADDERDGGPAPEDEGPGTEEEAPSEAQILAERRPVSVGEPLNTDEETPLAEVLSQEAPEEGRSQEEVDQESPADEEPPPEFRYAEVAGVGCAPNERIAYGTAGEFWEGDGTHSWAFGFEGGFDTENCDGRWHAIPVSGDPDAPNGRYAFWTFNIGFTDAQCEIYVHIPDAESPRWVGGAPAQYQLHPSADPATSEPFASFTVDQVADKGGWVHVGAYTPPGDTISVKLQNSGADQIDGQDTNAHVVASAVRTRCN
ncbi:Fibrinogen-binding protein [Nocardiopsis sp. JB363]|nr:Fibrinogen-binding protein [Nocardiopsis sp. JB363]